MMNKMSIILTVKNRTYIYVDYDPIKLKTFLRHNIYLSNLPKKEPIIKKGKIKLNLVINFLLSLDKLNEILDLEIIIADFYSTDCNLEKLKELFPNLNIKIILVDGYFSRGRGLNEGLKHATGDIIYFSDADMYFHTLEIFKKGIEECVKGNVFFPICFDLIDPTHQLGYWRDSGYGLFFITKKLIQKTKFKWNEYNSLGKEDNDAYSFFKNKSRYRVNGYFHQWHPNNKVFKNMNYKYNDYNKKKVLLNFELDDDLELNNNDYYFVNQLEMDIDYVCNKDKAKFNEEELKNYEKQFGKKLKYFDYKEFFNNKIIEFSTNFKPVWLEKLLHWMKQIEQNNYSWTLQGTDDFKLSACSLYAKLGTIYSNYYRCNKEKIKSHILSFIDKEDKMFKQDEEDLKIISETRQAYSGLINLGYDFNKNINFQKYYKKPLFFMNDKAWENPWSAGAQFSHYVFFCSITKNNKRLKEVLEQLEKYKTERGWLFGNPKDERIINGMMKVFTGFDVINKNIDEEMLKHLTDYLLQYENYDSKGGCGIYDYVYCLLKCTDINYRREEIKKKLLELYDIIIEHQMEDGGFKYSLLEEKEDKYSGKIVNKKGLYGGIHASTLFSMALTMINNKLDLGLDLNLAFS